LQITHNKSTHITTKIYNDPSDDNSMTPFMRGRKKQQPAASGHTIPHSDGHGALTGGGPGRGLARQDEMDVDVETSPSRKRKRGHNNSQHEDGEMSLDEPNGNDGEISDDSYSELGIRPPLSR
jgi:hypothetical protein